jgi:hypothetical protein
MIGGYNLVLLNKTVYFENQMNKSHASKNSFSYFFRTAWAFVFADTTPEISKKNKPSHTDADDMGAAYQVQYWKMVEQAALQRLEQGKKAIKQKVKQANARLEQANARLEQAEKKVELNDRELKRLRAENEQLRKAALKRGDIKQKNANKNSPLADNKNTFKYTESRVSASQKAIGSGNNKKNRKERLAQQAANI